MASKKSGYKEKKWHILTGVAVMAVVGSAGLLFLVQSQAAPLLCRNVVLRYGSNSSCTAAVQWYINVPSTPPFTKNFGPKTRDRVKVWQKAHGLVADGVVGPKTWSAICNYSVPRGLDNGSRSNGAIIGCNVIKK